MSNSIIRNLFQHAAPELYGDKDMNYVAYVMYRHKLERMPYIDAQNFCIKTVAYQNDRLIQALKHAVHMTRPDMMWWFERLLENMP